MVDFNLREQRLQSLREELRALESEAQQQALTTQRNAALAEGEAALQSGDLEGAERCFSALFQAGPDLPGAAEAHDGLSRTYRLLARRELDAGDLPQAQRVGQAWAELDPDDPAPRLFLAEIERRGRNPKTRRRFLFAFIILAVALLSVAWVMLDTTGSAMKPRTRLGGAREAEAGAPQPDAALALVEQASPSASEPATAAPPVEAAPPTASPLPPAPPATATWTAVAATAVLTPTAAQPTMPSAALATTAAPPTPTATPTATRQPPQAAPLTPAPPAVTPVPPTPSALALALPETMPAGLARVVEAYRLDPNRRFLIADQHDQTLIVWDPGNPLRLLPMSTGGGPEGYITPTWAGTVGRYVGTIASFNTYADDGWYLYESLGSILIHGAPYRLVGGQKQYEGLEALGNYPASHGCIRLWPDDARWLTDWNPAGAAMVILPFSVQVDLNQGQIGG